MLTLSSTATNRLDHQVAPMAPRCNRAVPDRGSQSENFIPLGQEVRLLDRPADQGGQPRIGAIPIREVELLVRQIPDPGRKTVPQEVAHPKDVVGVAGGVRVVLLDPKVRLMVEQAVQDIGGIPGRGVDDLAVERGLPIRNVGVGHDRRVGAVFQVHLPARLPTASSPVALTVRG